MTGKDAFAEAIESFRASVQDAPPRQLFPDPDALLAEVGISSLAQESGRFPRRFAGDAGLTAWTHPPKRTPA